jgi:hypothetical protein
MAAGSSLVTTFCTGTGKVGIRLYFYSGTMYHRVLGVLSLVEYWSTIVLPMYGRYLVATGGTPSSTFCYLVEYHQVKSRGSDKMVLGTIAPTNLQDLRSEVRTSSTTWTQRYNVPGTGSIPGHVSLGYGLKIGRQTS